MWRNLFSSVLVYGTSHKPRRQSVQSNTELAVKQTCPRVFPILKTHRRDRHWLCEISSEDQVQETTRALLHLLCALLPGRCLIHKSLLGCWTRRACLAVSSEEQRHMAVVILQPVKEKTSSDSLRTNPVWHTLMCFLHVVLPGGFNYSTQATNPSSFH